MEVCFRISSIRGTVLRKSFDDMVFIINPRHRITSPDGIFRRTRKAVLNDYWQRIWLNH